MNDEQHSMALFQAQPEGPGQLRTPPSMSTLITIDLDALEANYRFCSEKLQPATCAAVVKADAYGHGADDCARAAFEAGATALCVATVPEAVALRPAHPQARILVMGPAFGSELAAARDEQISQLDAGAIAADHAGAGYVGLQAQQHVGHVGGAAGPGLVAIGFRPARGDGGEPRGDPAAQSIDADHARAWWPRENPSSGRLIPAAP